MYSGTIHNCYDSHVHWMATGQLSTRLDLRELSSPADVQKLKVEPGHFQGDWLIGFGWDQNLWPERQFPTRQILDEIFPKSPVAFSRADGHATWTNTIGLQRAGLLDDNGGALRNKFEIPGGKVVVDENDQPTGVLIDSAEKLIDDLIPPPTPAEIRRFLLRGIRTFHAAGLTHIRDLTMDAAQFEVACHLEASGLLNLAVEAFFGAYRMEDYPKAFKAAIEAKRIPSQLLRVKGIKLFFDGALGSEGALLSQCYCSGSGHGLNLLKEEELTAALKQIWSSGLEAAVHVIGDEAAHRVAKVAQTVWDGGVQGRLNLEHVEMVRPETIALLKGRDVVCHMQPCHWLTDRRWLKSKVSPLLKFVFPWRALQEAQIPIFFGSDSPIEKPSILNTLQAIQESPAEGIPKLVGHPITFHQHPDSAWAPNSYTIFDEGVVREVVFRGEHLL